MREITLGQVNGEYFLEAAAIGIFGEAIAIGEKAESTHAIRIVPSPVDYWITTTYPRERAFRKWWLHQHQSLPLIQAYEELATQYPRGLADLAPLAAELSGEMQEAINQ